jgi:hypothetical protein
LGRKPKNVSPMALQVKIVGNAVILENQKVSENGRTIAV